MRRRLRRNSCRHSRDEGWGGTIKAGLGTMAEGVSVTYDLDSHQLGAEARGQGMTVAYDSDGLSASYTNGGLTLAYDQQTGIRANYGELSAAYSNDGRLTGSYGAVTYNNGQWGIDPTGIRGMLISAGSTYVNNLVNQYASEFALPGQIQLGINANGQLTGSYSMGGLTFGSNGNVSGNIGGDTPFGALGLNVQDGNVTAGMATDYGNIGLDSRGRPTGSIAAGPLGLGMHDGQLTGQSSIGPINLDYTDGQFGGGMTLGGSNVSYGNGSWGGTVEGNFLEQGLGQTGLDTSGFEITDATYNANTGWDGAFSNEFGTWNQDGQYSTTVIPDDGDQSSTWEAAQETAANVTGTVSDWWTSIFGGEKPAEQPQVVVTEQPGQPTEGTTPNNGDAGEKKPGYTEKGPIPGLQDQLLAEQAENVKYLGNLYPGFHRLLEEQAGIGVQEDDEARLARSAVRSVMKLSKAGWVAGVATIWEKGEEVQEFAKALEELRAIGLYGRQLLRDDIMATEQQKLELALTGVNTQLAEIQRRIGYKADQLERTFGKDWRAKPTAMADWDQFMKKVAGARAGLTKFQESLVGTKAPNPKTGLLAILENARSSNRANRSPHESARATQQFADYLAAAYEPPSNSYDTIMGAYTKVDSFVDKVQKYRAADLDLKLTKILLMAPGFLKESGLSATVVSSIKEMAKSLAKDVFDTGTGVVTDAMLRAGFKPDLAAQDVRRNMARGVDYLDYKLRNIQMPSLKPFGN